MRTPAIFARLMHQLKQSPRLGLLSLLAAGCLSTDASAQTFLFDFGAANTTTTRGASPDDPINYWNNVPDTIGTLPTGVITNIVAHDNASSTLGLAIVSRFNASNGNGTSASTLFAPDATRDSLYGNTETFNNASNIYPSFKITGLDPAASYAFTFYASRTGVGDNRETVYSVSGANFDMTTLDAANNIDNVATVQGMYPTESGEITISLAPSDNNNNPNHFTYLGVLKMVALPPQTPLGFTLEPVSTRGVEFGDVTFSAAVTGAVPHFIQWMSNGVPIPDATRLSYTITNLSLDMDGALFSVNVSNLAYSITSSNAVLRVVNDTNPPVVTSVSTTDGITFNVCFSEAMDALSAEEEFYYEFNEEVFAVSAVLDAGGRCVELTLDQKLSGTFTLTLEMVSDISGNPMPLTVLTGRVPEPETQMVLIDFGGAATTDLAAGPANDPVRYWNNLTTSIGNSDVGVLSSLVTTQNLVTTMGVSMIRRFNGVNENGTTSATAPFPTDATRDSLFGNTETFGGLANILPSFKLTGLVPDKTYTLIFFASRTGVTDNRETRYTIEGLATTEAFLNAANNVTNTAVASNIQPSAAGEITISLTAGPNNNNGNHFTYLGVLAIVPEVPQAPVTTLLAPVVSGGNLVLQWSGPGELESAPTIVGPWTPLTATSPGQYEAPVDLSTNRFFRVRQP